MAADEKYKEPPEIRLYWAALLASGGALLLFAILAAMKGFPKGRDWWINIWPLIAGGGVLLSGRLLFRHYKDHRAARRNFRLGLGDMIVSFVLMGVTFTVFQQVDERRFLAVGLPLGVLMLLCLLAGFMRAQVHGLNRWPAKQLYAVGHGFRNIGIIGVGALLMVMFFSIIAGVSPINVVSELFLRMRHGIIGILPHIAVGALILGMTLCIVAKHYSDRE